MDNRARIERVVDGDTVDVLINLGYGVWKEERVRIVGIDTPECRTRDLDEKRMGLMAKARVVGMCPAGGEVVLRGTERGKYGRILADIIVDDISVAETLICERLAVAYHGQSKEDIADEHLENRAWHEARQEDI
ncbi:MAG: thermonuclease family protein [Gemmatimonadetes bacterium]|nr:thermonuclease family protein [Gemmatimonadota bacterium]MYF79171.1 thermonuclease family protein [Chloroflexota bacterium]